MTTSSNDFSAMFPLTTAGVTSMAGKNKTIPRGRCRRQKTPGRTPSCPSKTSVLTRHLHS